MNSLDELISVLIPAYNHEKYIAEAIRSVIVQDWKRIELLVIDDGSSDSTWKVLQKLRPECEARFERVVFLQQQNAGQCATLNRLSQMVDGDFVAMLDSDDKFLPGAFKRLVKPMQEDSAIGVVVGQNQIIDSCGIRCYWDSARNNVYRSDRARYRTFNEYLCHKNKLIENVKPYGTYAAFVRGNHIPNGYIIRRTCFDAILPYHVEAPIVDCWLNLQLSKITSYFAVADETFCYRWHNANTVANEKYISSASYKTYKFEFDLVSSMADKRFLEIFNSQINRLKTVFSLFGILKILKVRSLDAKCVVFSIFGRNIVLRRREVK